MAKKRALTDRLISVQFTGFEEVMKRLNALDENVKQITEDALKAAHAHVTPTIEEAIQNQYLPAEGHHHRKGNPTEKGIIRTAKVKWSGTEATCDVGFNTSEAGMAWIFLLRGNVAHEKDQKLFDAIYSSRAEGEVRAIEKEIFIKGLKEAERK